MRKATVAWSLVVVAALGLACSPNGARGGESPRDAGEPRDGGDGGFSEDAGTRVDGGSGEVASGCGGHGGDAGERAWLDDAATWREIPGASSVEAKVRVCEAVPGALRFPPIQWESCGSGCEVAVMDRSFGENWYPAMDTVVTPTGPRVWTSFLLPGDGYTVRRFIDLGTGETVAALRIEPEPRNPSQHPLVRRAGKSPLALYMSADPTSDNGKRVEVLYDARSGAWELKLPWRETAGNTCEKFSVDSSPPAMFFGCGSVSVLAAAGSDELTTIEGSENFGSGGGNAGLAAWSERWPGLPRKSRIRTWSPDADSRVLVESMPGVACSVAVSADRITGIRSGDPEQAAFCEDVLAAPEFWSVSRQGGEVKSWRIPVTEPVFPGEGTSWGDYAAVLTLDNDQDLPQAQRYSIWLIRFTDGKMRRIVPSPGHDWRVSLLALDETHVYVGENKEREFGIVDQIYRYRLDQFKEIGTPLE